MQQKWREGGSKIKDTKCWESRDQATCKQIWHFSIGIQELGLQVEASDSSKQKARQLASQKFLKAFFPKGYTWNKLLEVIYDKKCTELETIFEEKN